MLYKIKIFNSVIVISNIYFAERIFWVFYFE